MWFWMRRTQIHDWAGLNVVSFVTVLVTGRSIAKHLVPTSQEYDDFTRFWTSDDVAPPGFARLVKDRHRAIFDPDGYGYGSRAWYTLEGGRLESLYVGIAYIYIHIYWTSSWRVSIDQGSHSTGTNFQRPQKCFQNGLGRRRPMSVDDWPIENEKSSFSTAVVDYKSPRAFASQKWWRFGGTQTNMSGWWYAYTSEKYEFVSWDDSSPNMEK